MHDKLTAYIEQYSALKLTNQEKALIVATFRPKKLRKKQYFLQEGDVCKYAGFIVKGAMRQYSVDEKGAEHIVQLLIENYWANDRESSAMLTASKYNIEACEDTELLILTRAEMLDLIEKIPAMAKMVFLMDERNSIANQRRVNSTISSTAEKRYEEFAGNHHNLSSVFRSTPSPLFWVLPKKP